MEVLEKTKLYALEIVNLIDNGNLQDFKTYGKIGEVIEKLDNIRLEVLKTLVKK